MNYYQKIDLSKGGTSNQQFEEKTQKDVLRGEHIRASWYISENNRRKKGKANEERETAMNTGAMI